MPPLSRRLEDIMAARLIAVVNHEPTYLRLVETILKTEGYDVLTVTHRGVCYELLKREQPEAILIDTWLGDRDGGWKLLQRLKLDPETATIPVIVASSDDPKAIRERFTQKSRDGTSLLFKPFDPQDLLDAVKVALDGHHA
jgi:CheY-like chemotaxis protein